MNALTIIDQPAADTSETEQHDTFSPARQAEFLKSLQLMGNISIACRHVRIARQTAYRVRRANRGFARAWDTALVAARTHAEAELADRAIFGVEEEVFYHGELIAKRRRHDGRLLLAHLARLDRMAEREDVAASLAVLDEEIAALERGEVLPDEAPLPVTVLRDASACDLGSSGRTGETVADDAPENALDTVTSVTPPDAVEAEAPPEPCPDCGGLCLALEDDPAAQLGPDDCQWFGNRLARMIEARPTGSLVDDDLDPEAAQSGELDCIHIAAFEAGLPRWWRTGSWQALHDRLAAHGAQAGSAGAGAQEGLQGA